MYKINVDTPRNRLYITLVGFFTTEEIKRCSDECIAATRRLRTGYDVVTDISEFKPGTPDVARDLQRVQTHFTSSGVGRGVRIVGQNMASSMQFSRVSTKAGFQSTSVASAEEAEAFLSAKQ